MPGPLRTACSCPWLGRKALLWCLSQPVAMSWPPPLPLPISCFLFLCCPRAQPCPLRAGFSAHDEAVQPPAPHFVCPNLQFRSLVLSACLRHQAGDRAACCTSVGRGGRGGGVLCSSSRRRQHLPRRWLPRLILDMPPGSAFLGSPVQRCPTDEALGFLGLTANPSWAERAAGPGGRPV